MRVTKRPDAWWAVHNLIAHPLSEVCHWGAVVARGAARCIESIGDRLHDGTVPEHDAGSGRG